MRTVGYIPSETEAAETTSSTGSVATNPADTANASETEAAEG